jgi:hypothetical protein
MPTTTLPTASRMINLAKAAHGLLVTSGLPEPVALGLDYYANCVKIQPRVTANGDPVAVLSALLLWSRLLHDITADWAHIPAGNLHITIHGRLLSGTRVCVYKSVPFDAVREWVLLEPGQRDTPSLDELADLIRNLHTTRPAV